MFKMLNLKTFATPSLCQILTLKANMCKNYPQIYAKITHKYVPKWPTNMCQNYPQMNQLKAYYYLKHLVTTCADIFKSKIFIVRTNPLTVFNITQMTPDSSNYRQIHEITNISEMRLQIYQRWDYKYIRDEITNISEMRF